MRAADRQAGFTLLEVLVALAIVAIAVFPMLQITEQAEKSAFDAKFYAVASNGVRALMSRITATARPGDREDGDFQEFTEDTGFDLALAYANILYEWEVSAVDLSADVSVGLTEEEEEELTTEEKDTKKDAALDEAIDDRFRARYVRISVHYTMDSGDEREMVVETYLPPLPRTRDTGGRIPDAVPPNRGP